MTITVAQPLPEEIKVGGSIPLWIYFVIAFVIVAAVIALIRLRRRPPKEVTRTPVEAFLEGLTALKKESGGDLKKFQSGLYQLLTTYISIRYHVNVTGKTAEGIVAELESQDIDPETKKAISGWLIKAETEKFSPISAQPGEVIRLETEVRQQFEKMR